MCSTGLFRPGVMGTVAIKSHLTMTCCGELHLLGRVLDIYKYKEENQQGSTVQHRELYSIFLLCVCVYIYIQYLVFVCVCD